jgi:hypothetical protein
VNRASAPARWRGYAFGLGLEGWPLGPSGHANGYFAAPTIVPSRGAQGKRQASLDLVAPAEIERAWRPGEATTLVERRFLDGSLLMRIDRHAEVGYRIWVPRHGRHLVSHDGRHIRSALPHVSQWRWQRLLFAQALPLAAALQGLALFHASAVALGEHVLGFVARAGTGKSSLAAHLVGRGASFVTDDVLALESAPGGGVLAHPGPGMAAIDLAEWRALGPDGRARLGEAIGLLENVYVSFRPAARALPLRLLYFVERGEQVQEFRLEEVTPPDPRLLLGSGFLPYVRTEDRLASHLDLCARIAGVARMVRARIPASLGAGDAAALIEEHARSLLDAEERP